MEVLFFNFNGNRFNIVFYCAQVLFHDQDRVQDFLQDMHGPTNLLFQKILNSMKSDIYLLPCDEIDYITILEDS